MKIRITLFLACCLYIGFAYAQSTPIVKGYAFGRQTLSGVAPSIIVDEDGTERSSTKPPAIEYFIYVETSPKMSVKFDNIWIKGKWYSVKTSEVKTLPVTVAKTTYNSKILNDTLVYKTRSRLWQLNVKEMIHLKGNLSSQAAKQSKTNEVVIAFRHKRKCNYYGIPKLKMLESVRLQ
jgi:hypothetical protein